MVLVTRFSLGRAQFTDERIQRVSNMISNTKQNETTSLVVNFDYIQQKQKQILHKIYKFVQILLFLSLNTILKPPS